MSNEVTTQHNKSVIGFDQEQVRAIKALIDPSNKLDDVQIQLFLHVCKERKLDPRLNQIYAIPRWNSNTKRTEITIQVSIDGLRLIAERTGKYAPGKDTQYIYNEKGALLGATSYVKKMTPDGMWHEISATAFLREYMPSNGKGLWGQMPHVMIEKCAESRALRRAFPDQLSGLYSEEEMTQAIKPELSEEEVDVLQELLIDLPSMKKNILDLVKKETNQSEIKFLPRKYYDRVLHRCREEIKKFYNDQVTESLTETNQEEQTA